MFPRGEKVTQEGMAYAFTSIPLPKGLIVCKGGDEQQVGLTPQQRIELCLEEGPDREANR